MTTPFQRHKIDVAKRLAVESQQRKMEAGQQNEPTLDVKDYGQFEILKGALDQDLRALSSIPSGAEKQTRKFELAKRYTEYVNAYIESGEEYANPVMVQWLIWTLDAGRLDLALPVAQVAIKQNQVMPDTFNRNLITFVYDAVLAWAESEYKQGNSVAPYFYDMLTTVDSDVALALPDVVRMKYNKLAGHICFDDKNFEAAVTYYEMALKLETPNQPAKVATKLGEARKQIEKQNTDTEQKTESTEPNDKSTDSSTD